MKCKSTLFALLACCVLAAVSCEKIQPNKDNTRGKLDGLWVEQVRGEATVVPHLDIKGKSVILCNSKPLEYDYSDRVKGKLEYEPRTNKGLISFVDGSVLDFICDEQGNICTMDTVAYYRIDNNLDSLQALKTSPRLQLSADYVGPEKDLGIDLSCKPLLQGTNLTAGGAWYVEMLKFAGESFAKGAISWAGGKALETLVSCFYTDPTSQKLEDILNQVSALNDKLNEVEQLIKKENYEFYINQRTNDFCDPLTNYSQKYSDALAEAVKAKSDSTVIARILNEWHDDSNGAISGKLGGPMDAAANYMDFLMNTLVDQTNLYQIYDIYTFNCVPWAIMGYDFRQGLRACDLALIHSNAQMAMMYASIHHWENDLIHKNDVAKLNEKYQKFLKFCDANPVDVTDNVVCQIPGAHFVMKKDLIYRNYNIPPMNWYTVGSRFYHDESTTADLVYYGGMNMSVQQFKQKQITPNELTSIVNYYADKPSFSVQKILEQGGANVIGVLLLLNGETTVDWDDRLHLYLVQFNHEGNYRYPRESCWLYGECHWSWFAYYFDGWKYKNEQPAGATDILYRY